MQLALSYSLRKFLEDNIETQAIIHYDGVELPSNETFFLVKPRSNQYRNISKARETVEMVYRFELGLFAKTLVERSETQDETDELFLFKRMPVYTDEGEKTKNDVKVDVINEVPIFPEEVSSETNMNRLYFNLEIRVNRHKNKGEAR